MTFKPHTVPVIPAFIPFLLGRSINAKNSMVKIDFPTLLAHGEKKGKGTRTICLINEPAHSDFSGTIARDYREIKRARSSFENP